MGRRSGGGRVGSFGSEGIILILVVVACRHHEPSVSANDRSRTMVHDCGEPSGQSMVFGRMIVLR